LKELQICLGALRIGVLWSQDAPHNPERVFERP